MNLPHQSTRCLILGSGPAGCSAAIYAARALLEPVMIEGLQPGGQLTITTDVENYPGFAETIQGPWLMERMRDQALAVGTHIVRDIVVAVDLSRRPFLLTMDSGAIWLTDALIIATGAQAKWLGLPSETKFQGAGVSACATCDGFFFRGRSVVVVGGGNTAVEESLYLAGFASRVTLVHRRDALRAEPMLTKRLLTHPKINVIWNHEVEEILGESPLAGVVGVRLRHSSTGETRDLPCEGVFVAIGHAPASELFLNQLQTNEGGYIRVQPGGTATSIPGVYAAGDVADDVFRQAVTAAGMGCSAALEAVRFLAEEKHSEVGRAAA